MNKIKVGVVGSKGRMGKEVISAILQSDKAILSSCTFRHAAAEDNGVKIVSSITQVFQDADIVIEFTNPETMRECLLTAQETGVPLVSGTTSHNNYELIQKVAKTTTVLWSANMSFGVNIMLKLVKEIAKKLNEDYDIEISEVHHRAKKDAPSGTAIMLGKAAAEGRNIDFESVQAFERNQVRKSGDIGFATSRGGGIFGEHNVMFASDNEYLKLSHVGLNRSLFAQGAVKAGIWLYNKPKGYYSIQDLLDE